MSGSKAKLFPTTGTGVVDVTNKTLVWDVLEQRLTVIVADVTQVVAGGGSSRWPKMTTQNLSSFWGPSI